jgi:hypothetical protein
MGKISVVQQSPALGTEANIEMQINSRNFSSQNHEE